MAQAGIGDLYVGGLTPVVSTALEVSHQLASVGGSITALTIHNYSGSPAMVMLLDQTAAPTNGSVTPIWAYPIAGTSANGPGALSPDWTFAPLGFVHGLYVVLSTVTTTPFTLTQTTAVGFFSATVNTA